MSLSLLVPMRGQPIRRELFKYTFARTLRTPCQVVIRVDEDDTNTQRWVEDNCAATVLVGPRYDGYRSLGKFFNEMMAVATGDLIMFGNDDMRFETVDWVRAYERAANKYRDGVFNLGCMTFPAGAYPFSCISRRMIEAVGWANDERIIYQDIYWRDIAVRLGRAEFLPHIAIAHIGFAGDDAMSVKAGIDRDPASYWQLHDACVTEAVEKIRPLMLR